MIQIRTHHARWLCLATLGSLVGSASGGALYFEDFDDAPGAGDSQYDLSSTQFQSGPVFNPTSYFLRLASATPFNNSTFNGAQGGYIAGLNTNSTTDTHTMTTDGFDISGSPMLQFSFDLARHSSGSFWGDQSEVEIEYEIDGGGWESLTTIDTNGIDNVAPLFGSTEITNSFQTFTTTLNGMSGTSMQLRITWADLGPGDSLAVDNITVTAVPLPPAVFGGLGLLGGLLVVRRLRRR